jgi:hypothetical protein
MVYFLYGLGLTLVLYLAVHDNFGATALLQADFVFWWLIISVALLGCCSKLPCMLCRYLPGSWGVSCRVYTCHPEKE